ncbi:MAG: aldehyde dehydrogenase family protein [Chloroflexales bacterium]|nr:aldehyde dehydrogenase family protein [Chloroflexales bacterium]
MSDLPYHPLYIAGQWVDAADNERFTVMEPATGEPLATVALAGAGDVDRAVRAARAAFDHGPWPHNPPAERAQILHAIADALEARSAELAELEARDCGATIRKTTFLDIPFGIEHLRTFAELARRHPYEPLPWVDMPSVSWNFVWREPVGVCGQIIPWNFPFVMSIWKIAPALATGNCVVIKPATLAPLSTIALVRTIDALGVLPRGVLNLVQGEGVPTGEALVEHPGVDKIAFTGSTAVGKRVMALAANTLKRVTLELGGKSPSILMPDADLDLAVDGVLFGAFLHAGQYCESGTRCFVPDTLHDELVSRLRARIASIRLGDPLDLQTDIGPLISEVQRQRVEGYIALGRDEGAQLVCGGGRPQGEAFARGPYIEPTLFAGVRNSMRLAQEEIFGPVLAVIPYGSVTEAIELANTSSYGLGAAIWSRDIQAAIEVAKRVRAGTVWINDHHLLNAVAPFGGYKQSGSGRELGLSGLHAYTEEKHIHVDLIQKRQGRLWWDALLPE